MAINLPKFGKDNPFKNFKITGKSSRDSLDWFGGTVDNMLSGEETKKSAKIKELTTKNGNGNDDRKPSLLKDFNAPKGLQLGSLYLQSYDAKHKATLPVWDSLPLFFLLKFNAGGYLGLNLHYMDIATRVAVLGTLMEYANNDKMDSTTRLQLSWSLINSVSKLEPLKDCIKHYLFDHVTSTPVFISPENWLQASQLPIANWHYNTNKNKVS